MYDIELLEKLEYYEIKQENINQKLFLFDAVKKVIIFYPAIFWVQVSGGIKLDSSPSFTKTISFYVYNYYENQEDQQIIYNSFLKKIATLGLNFDAIFTDYKSLKNFLLENLNFEKDFTIGISWEIKNNKTIYNYTDFVERYTNEHMLNLEALVVCNFILNCIEKGQSKEKVFVISDGGLSKFRKFLNILNLNQTILVGLIKNVEINYLSEYGNNYLYALPYGKRTSAFFIYYENFKVLSFYLNIGKLVRIEVLSENLEHLLKPASLIISLSYLPQMYYRMPQNNIIFTKLEKNLKNYIINEVLFNKIYP